MGEGETSGYPLGADSRVEIAEHLREPSEVLCRSPRREVNVPGRRHCGRVQLAGVSADDDVLDTAVVERFDDLERVEALDAQPGTLVFLRARRAADTAWRSFATRAPW
jgi:hypothetical protein